MQMGLHIVKNSLFSKYQSAYRKLFSTETALVKVTNDLLLNLDKTKSTFFRLDLSAAFNTLNLELLLSIFETRLGFKDKVVAFFLVIWVVDLKKCWLIVNIRCQELLKRLFLMDLF